MKDKIQNRITINGYLKENNLEERTGKDNTPVIRGTFTVAFDALDSIRVDVYCAQYTASGKENKAYSAVAALLPANTMSIKNLLEADGSATFDTVKNAATKIVAYAEFRERAWTDDRTNTEVSRVQYTLCNYFNSIHVPSSTDDKFEPGASFVADIYIESIRPEMGKTPDGEMDETGRLIVTGLIPDFKGMMQRVTFVTEAGGVSEYVGDNWRVGESTYVTGMYHNLKVVTEKPSEQAGFGQAAGERTVTTFVEERVIRGGGQTSVDANEDGLAASGFTADDVREGLQARAEAIQKSNEARATRGAANAGATSTTAAAPKTAAKNFGFGDAVASGNTAPKAAPGGFDPNAF